MAKVWITIATLLVASGASLDVSGQGRAPLPTEERGAPPPPDPISEEGDAGVWKTIAGWHNTLAQHMPAPVAWIILTSPIWLAIVVLMIVRLLRRRRRGAIHEHRIERMVTIPTPPEPTPPELSPPSAIGRLLDHETSPPEYSRRRRASLHQIFVVLSRDLETLSSLRELMPSFFSATSWNEALAGQNYEPLGELGPRWTRVVARERVRAWLSEHPLIATEGISVSLPDELDPAVLDAISLLRSDGLAIQMDGPQTELIRQVRRALTLTYRGADNPFVLELVARRTDVPAVYQGPDDTAELVSSYPLALLLFGRTAYHHAVGVGLVEDSAHQLQERFDEHDEQFGRPIPAAGSAFYSLYPDRSLAPGMDMALACIGGAAFSPAAVGLYLSKSIKDLPKETHQVLAELGLRCALALTENATIRQRLGQNLEILLGAQELDQAIDEVTALQRQVDKSGAGNTPSLPGIKPQQSPELALLQHHRNRLIDQRALTSLAAERAKQIWAKVSFAGKTDHDRTLAAVRLGYYLVGLGPVLFQGTTGEIRQAAEQAMEQLAKVQS